MLINSARHRPNLGRLGPNSANFRPLCTELVPNSGHFGPNLDRCVPMSINVGANSSNPAHMRPESTGFGPSLAKSARFPNLGQIRPGVGQCVAAVCRVQEAVREAHSSDNWATQRTYNIWGRGVRKVHSWEWYTLGLRMGCARSSRVLV